MKNKVHYEWCWEQLAADSEILELYNSEKIQEKPFSGFGNLLLIREVYFDCDVIDRQRAYVDDGIFEDETFDYGAKIPKRFIAELEKFNRRNLNPLYPGEIGATLLLC